MFRNNKKGTIEKTAWQVNLTFSAIINKEIGRAWCTYTENCQKIQMRDAFSS